MEEKAPPRAILSAGEESALLVAAPCWHYPCLDGGRQWEEAVHENEILWSPPGISHGDGQAGMEKPPGGSLKPRTAH